MCFYVLRLPICGHCPYPPPSRPSLLLNAFCRAFETELQRIHSDFDVAWSTPAARASVPFQEPPSCSPQWAPENEGGNIFVEWRGFCGLECENSFVVPSEEETGSVGEDDEQLVIREGSDVERWEGFSDNGPAWRREQEILWRRKLRMRRLKRGAKGAKFGVKREGIGWPE